APEVLAGQISRWSDQFALAVTYCLLRGGRLPYDGTDRLRAPDLTMLPEEERPAVARALARDPAPRWAGCRALVQGLRDGKRPLPTPNQQFDSQIIQSLLQDYDRDWAADRLANRAQYLPATGSVRGRALIELIKADLRCRWLRGHKKELEAYLHDFP